jgi:hypothetical protein
VQDFMASIHASLEGEPNPVPAPANAPFTAISQLPALSCSSQTLLQKSRKKKCIFNRYLFMASLQ